MQNYNPAIHHRRTIRLKGYDYSQAGLYFVTVCVQNHECLFGEIKNGEMRLNEYGKIIRETIAQYIKNNPVRWENDRFFNLLYKNEN